MFLCGTMFLWIPSFTFFLFNNKTGEFLMKKAAHFLKKFDPVQELNP